MKILMQELNKDNFKHQKILNDVKQRREMEISNIEIKIKNIKYMIVIIYIQRYIQMV